MSSTLTNTEMEALAHIGKDIFSSLNCNINGCGVPCRTDRMSAVDNMAKYLKIHDFEVINRREYARNRNQT